MTIAFGDLVNCAVNPVSDTDIFRFAGAAGDKLVVQAVSQSGGSPCIELFNPQGRIGSQNCSSPARIDLLLTSTGTHSILVSEFLSNSTMTYALSLERVAPPSPSATMINFGQDLSGVINPVGDIDLYFFNGSAGDKLVIQAPPQSGGSPCLELFDHK